MFSNCFAFEYFLYTPERSDIGGSEDSGPIYVKIGLLACCLFSALLGIFRDHNPVTIRGAVWCNLRDYVIAGLNVELYGT